MHRVANGCIILNSVQKARTNIMQSENIEISTSGVKAALKKYDPYSAVAEFVWNGFDAGAKNVEITYKTNPLGAISELWIIDDGVGIPRQEISHKFKPFLQTNKSVDPKARFEGPSASHGKNGYGRLTFFHFANSAEWMTTYQTREGQYRSYSITIDAALLNKYTPSQESDSAENATGTKVRFSEVEGLNADEFPELSKHLAREFAWFLELKSPFKRQISINGKALDYEALIADEDTSELSFGQHRFEVRYVRWDERLHDEYSRYYFLGSDLRERAKKHTTFNNKGDGFFHSVYIQSSYFDSVKEHVELLDQDDDQQQMSLPLPSLAQDGTFKALIKQLEEYLRKKRSPFLRKRAQRYVKGLETDKAFPHFGEEPWEQQRKHDLTVVVQELYEADPRIFSNLNLQQKQTIVRLFNLVIDSSERDHLLEVLSEVVNLSSQGRKDLAKILKSAQLSNVIASIKLIQDRFTAVDELRKMVFVPSFGANERDHLQTHIERHFWLFGEKYHLVTAAEPDFEDALKRYLYVLRGEVKSRKIQHPGKNQEMDIFAVRQLKGNHNIETNNIVVELKHPNLTLGTKELQQVKNYMDVILKQPEFNAEGMTWDFYLVGKDYDEKIVGEIENAQNHGEKQLVYKTRNYKIYVFKWSDVLNNFELRHGFVLEKLKLERACLAAQGTSADDIIANGHLNSAALQPATQPLSTVS